MDPFLKEFQHCLVDKSYAVIYACADDLGTAVIDLFVLKQLARVFKVMNAVSCLVLQVKICVIVPLVPFSDSNVKFIKDWLACNLPRWAGFKLLLMGNR